MRALKFDTTVKAGDILTAVAVVVAAFTPWFQAHSVALTEKELGLKINDVAALAAALESEVQQREGPDIGQMLEYAEGLGLGTAGDSARARGSARGRSWTRTTG